MDMFETAVNSAVSCNSCTLAHSSVSLVVLVTLRFC